AVESAAALDPQCTGGRRGCALAHAADGSDANGAYSACGGRRRSGNPARSPAHLPRSAERAAIFRPDQTRSVSPATARTPAVGARRRGCWSEYFHAPIWEFAQGGRGGRELTD